MKRSKLFNNIKIGNPMQMNQGVDSLIPWKHTISTTIESLLIFYIATFCMAMFLMHKGENWLIPGITLGLLYLFVIFACAKRVIEKLSLATIMLIIPLAPLIALIMIISLIPILQMLS
jgi:hypothetical protein